jgi:hypothetical protein
LDPLIGVVDAGSRMGSKEPFPEPCAPIPPSGPGPDTNLGWPG